MMPGRMNSREVKRMMAQMGIKTTDLTDVRRVIMEGDSRNYVITEASVTKIDAKGEVYFQVSGKLSTTEKKVEGPQEPTINQEDVNLVIEQTHVSREKAVEALKKAKGEVAQAIMDLMEQ
ncbi:MAG: nascent polypeptide-associated complex protein [Thermoplasmataceae archaeon]